MHTYQIRDRVEVADSNANRAEWADHVPGFIEIDPAPHDGGNASGKFSFTLTVTDFSKGWTASRPLRNEAASRVFEALQ